MIVAATNETLRTHRVPINVESQLVSVKLQHNTASQSCNIYFLGVNIDVNENR